MQALLDARLGRRISGIGQYTLQLAEQLTRLAPDEVLCAVTARHRRALATAGRRPIVVAPTMDLAASAPRVDLVHGPNFHAPALPGARRVATVHDLGFISLPECHPPGMPERLDATIRHTLDDTSLFLCDSTWTQSQFVDYYAVEPERCCVVPLGVSEQFSPNAGSPQPAVAARLIGIRQPYLLHVGAMVKRKDLGTLLRAFELAATEQPDLALVLAGNKTRRWASDWPTVRRWLQSNPRLRQRVRILGYVPAWLLPQLYRDASAVVSTSLLEGFGLTMLEGLASGVPVVATAGSAVEELAGEIGYFGQARDAESYAAAISSALRGDLARRARGWELARRLTWRRTAELTLDAYRTAISAERRG